jgi:hypothetical protein
MNMNGKPNGNYNLVDDTTPAFKNNANNPY